MAKCGYYFRQGLMGRFPPPHPFPVNPTPPAPHSGLVHNITDFWVDSNWRRGLCAHGGSCPLLGAVKAATHHDDDHEYGDDGRPGNERYEAERQRQGQSGGTQLRLRRGRGRGVCGVGKCGW